MIILSPLQFNINSFSSLDYDVARLLYSSLEWQAGIWQSNGIDYPIDVKISRDGEIIMVMTSTVVFINNDYN